jgi:DNA-binding CsgD family transcriptional regulator/PAS domain-containing protein
MDGWRRMSAKVRSSHITNGCCDLIGQVYECVEDTTLWQVFIERYADLVAANSAILIAHDRKTGRASVLAAVDVDLEYQRKYGGEYASRDIYLERARTQGTPLGVALPGHVICPEDDLERSEYYQEYLRPQKVYHSLGGLISTPLGFVNIGATRPRSAPRFNREDVQSAQQLMPHLGRALRLSDQLRTTSSALAAAEVLYQFSLPVIMFDCRGTVAFVNAAVVAILRQQDGLELRQGKLLAAHPAETSALRNLVGSAIAGAEGNPEAFAGTLQITRKSFRRPYIASVYPLRQTSAAGREVRAIVLITDPEASAVILSPSLTALFGLTPAESCIAEKILNGQTLEKTAATLSIGIETARTHLKRVMSKTDTNRQADLVRLLLNAAATTGFEVRTGINQESPAN